MDMKLELVPVPVTDVDKRKPSTPINSDSSSTLTWNPRKGCG